MYDKERTGRQRTNGRYPPFVPVYFRNRVDTRYDKGYGLRPGELIGTEDKKMTTKSRRATALKGVFVRLAMHMSEVCEDMRRAYACAAGLVAVAMRILLMADVPDPVLTAATMLGVAASLRCVLGIFLALYGLVVAIACYLPRRWAVRLSIASALLAFLISAAVATSAMYLGAGAAWLPYAACDMQILGAVLLLLWSVVDGD